MRLFKRPIDKTRLLSTAHSKAFHTSHGCAHIAYFVAVLVEGHGMYALIGGVMVIFSFITVVTDTEGH
jgi:hypothetical protein